MSETYRGKNHDWEDGEFTSEGREYEHRCRKCEILCRIAKVGKKEHRVYGPEDREAEGFTGFPVYNRTDFDDCNMRIVKEVMTS